MTGRVCWSREDRAILLKMVHAGHCEQAIREHFSYYDKYGARRAMSADSFARQLKKAMVESGEIKVKTPKRPSSYKVSPKGRLTIHDFQDKSGARPQDEFIIRAQRGNKGIWQIIPLRGNDD